MDDKQKEEYKKALILVEDQHPTAHILAKAHQVIRRESTELRTDQLTDLLRQDSSLTADIIRVSNGAFYGYATASKDLDTSVNRIGVDDLLNVLSLVIAKNVYHKDLEHYQMSAVEHWSESVACAMLMEWLCLLMGENAQEAYTMGLLCVLGKTVINCAFDIFGDEDCYDQSQSVVDWERDILGFDHAHASAVLLKRWEFPVDIIGPIKYQFDPDKDPDQSQYAHALYFTRCLLDLCGTDFSHLEFSLDESMTELLSKWAISEEDLQQGLVDIQEKINVIKADFGV